MERFMANDNEIDIEFPSLQIVSLNMQNIPLNEYMHYAFSVSRTCGIEMHLQEDEKKYRLDFYLHKSIIMGTAFFEWQKLISGSDMVCVAVCPDRPKTVRISCYRSKE